MPTFDVTSPDGRKFRVTAPDGASQDEILAYAQKNMPAQQEQEPPKPANDNASSIRSLIPPMAGGALAPDLLMGARQVWDAAAQLGARGAESIANKFGGSKTLTGMREDTERVNKAAMGDYAATFDPENQPGSSFARGAGQALVTGPMTPAIKAAGAIKSALGGAGIGAGAGALTPVYDSQDFWGEKAKQMGVAALFGGVLGGAGGALGKSAPTTDARKLQEAGVRVPVGRAAGGGLGRLEEGAESVPLAGDVIRGAHRRAVEDFNRATYDKVLAPIGESLSPATAGRDAVKEARVKISKAYESALDKIGRVDLDKTFSDEGTKVAQMTAELGESAQKQFLAVLKNRVFDRITPAGTMSATTMKQTDSDIGRIASGLLKSQDQNQRGLGMALFEVQAALRRNVERSAGPELAGQVKSANEAWAQWVRVADASTRAGSKEGVFSPAALRAATQKADKRKFREGDALLQDWAQSAESVLGPKVPDSGSPYRLLGAAGLGGLVDPTIATSGAGLALAYTPAGQKVLSLLANKADRLKDVAPYLGLLAAPALSGSQ